MAKQNKTQAQSNYPSIILPPHLAKQSIVIQPNPITLGAANMTALERNLFALTLLHIKERYRNDIEAREKKGPFLFPEMPDCTYKIPRDMLTGEHGVGANITEIWKAADKMRMMNLGWKKPEGGFVSTGLYSYSEYDPRTKELTVVVSDAIMKRLMEHKSGFTYYNYITLINLKGQHTKKLYQLCKMAENYIIWRISVEELKMMFNLDTKYVQYGPFKKKVLDPAREEMETAYRNKASEIYFEYKEIKKKGTKKIEFIEFIILSDNPIEVTSDVKNYTLMTLAKTLSRTKDKKWRDNILHVVGVNALRIIPRLYIRLRKIEEEAEEKNTDLGEFGGLVRHILKKDFEIDF